MYMSILIIAIILYQYAIAILTYHARINMIIIKCSISTQHFYIDIPPRINMINSKYYISTYHFCVDIPCLYQQH